MGTVFKTIVDEALPALQRISSLKDAWEKEFRRELRENVASPQAIVLQGDANGGHDKAFCAIRVFEEKSMTERCRKTRSKRDRVVCSRSTVSLVRRQQNMGAASIAGAEYTESENGFFLRTDPRCSTCV